MERNKKLGFSLVEVVVVLVAVAVLSTILFISYSTYMESAKSAAAKSNSALLQKIGESYNLDFGTYPDRAGKFLLGSKNIQLPKNLSIIADADDTPLNSDNGMTTLAYACVDSCTNSKILGGRISYWDYSSKSPRYLFIGSATAVSSFDYPPHINYISSGDNSNCAPSSNNLTYCWGFSGTGQFANSIEGEELAKYPTPVSTKSPFAISNTAKVSTGQLHACAMTKDSKLYCWGNNDSGQLGNGSSKISFTPTAINMTGALSGKTIKDVELGMNSSCAIASNDLLYCWGFGADGQLGNGAGTTNSSPVQVSMPGALATEKIKSVAIGWTHACAIATDNKVYCWGDNSEGQLGNSSTSTSLTPTPVTTSGALSGLDAKFVTAGRNFTCIIASNDRPYCWGAGSSGQLGNTASAQSTVPVPVTYSGVMNGKILTSISSGWLSTCASSIDGKAFCWGYGGHGQLGNNSTNSSNTPVAVLDSGALAGKTIKSVRSGTYHICANTNDNMAFCWGSNTYGALSQELNMINSSVPVKVYSSGVLSRLSIKQVSGGTNYSCLLASDDNVYCWGTNNSGQLGNGRTADRLIPTKSIAGPLLNKNLSAIAVNLAMCAADQSGIPYCWGDNANGQTGAGNSIGIYTPTAVDRSGALSGKTIKKFASGLYHVCAIASDNLPYCWGNNGSSGHFGNNDTNGNTAQQVYMSGVLNGKTVKDITTGQEHTCVISNDDLPYCWGLNSNGQLGNNSTAVTLQPVEVQMSGVLSGKTVKSITAGAFHTCMITNDDLAYCWGYNWIGMLGDGTYSQSTTPRAVVTSGVLSGKTFKSIAAGVFHTCAIASDDKPYCWGYNAEGQLGDNSYVSSNVPVTVNSTGILAKRTVKSISSGDNHVCVVTNLNEASCWGTNKYGQLGNNSNISSPVPTWVVM